MCILLMNVIEKIVAEKPPHTKFFASLGSAAAAARKLCVSRFNPEPKTVTAKRRIKLPM